MLRDKLTYANVMATIAVFLVLGGGAYAATMLPKNSVGTKQLKNGSITPSKLSGAAKESLKGATGPQGSAGPQGSPGATKVVVRFGPVAVGQSVASCQSGEVATGGGGEAVESETWLWFTGPVQGSGEVPKAWEANATDAANTDTLVQAYVICASP
jgi:hypothetical protein